VKERCGKARNPSRLPVQAVCSNVTERTFDLVAPGCIGIDGASDCSEELEEEKSAAGCRKKVMAQGEEQR
jgi:hypothetical protein